MKKIIQTRYFSALLLFSVILILVLATELVFGWAPPTQNPPSGNGVLYQTSGNVGIGGSNPNYLLTISSSTDTLFKLNRIGGTSPTQFRLGTNNILVINNNGSDTLTLSGPNVSWAGSLTGGSVPWARLTSFPSACPGGQYVSAVGGTLTCSAPSVVEVDGVIGNEVTNATNGTLTRSGSGTAVSPYTLGLNLANANSWTGAQTFGANTNFPGSGIWNTSGNVGIGTTAPSTKLHVVGGARITGLVSCNTIDTDASGNLVCGTDASGGGLPAGTSGQTLRHDGTNWIANSNLFNNGTNVGIGTASVDSNYKITTASGGIKAESTTQPAGYFNSSSGYGLLVNAGNVGIGTLAPGAKLEVNGTIKLSGASPTYKIINLLTPTASSDAATKGYVDAQVGSSGINVKQATCSTGDCITTATCNSGTIITSAVSVNGTTACGSGAQANPTATYRTRADCWGNSSCSQTGTRTPSPLGACVAIVCEK